ncbi:unnamed protein product [Auanema sp. JU1783]|nr:unnamed protein product [Auanema sp. JU1783]
MPELPPTAVIIRLQFLPLSANSADVRAFFHGLKIPEGGVHIIGGENGDVFVGFASDEDARQAMRRDRGSIHGQEIRLLLSSRSEMTEVVAKAKTFYHSIDRDQSLNSKKAATGSEEAKNSWKATNVPPANFIQQQTPSTYAPDSDYNKPAYARIPPNGGHEPYGSTREPHMSTSFNGHINQRVNDVGPPQKFPFEKEPLNGPVYNRRPPVKDVEMPARYYGGPTKDPRSIPYARGPPKSVSPDLKKDFGDNSHRADSKMPPVAHRGMHTPPSTIRNNFNGTYPPQVPQPDRHLDLGKDTRDPMNYSNNLGPSKNIGPPPPVRNETWRNNGRGNGRERNWDSRHDTAPYPERKPYNPMKNDVFDDMPNRMKPHVYPPNPRGGLSSKPGRGPNGFMENQPFIKRNEQHYLELSRLPNEMLRHQVLEDFVKPSIPLNFDSFKIVYSPEGILMHTLVRVECEEDAKNLMSRDGEQGIKIRMSRKQIFDEADDSFNANNSPSDRTDYKKKRSRSPEDRRRRRERRSRSRDREVRRSRSPPQKRGKQDPNRWCLLLTNVPFRISEAELREWLGDRADPIQLVRTYYANGNASDRWIAEFENESIRERVKGIRSQLQGRTVKIASIDNDFADELKKVEDKYGDGKKKENELKMMAEIQLQKLNGSGRDPPPVQHFPTPAYRGRGGFPRGRPPLAGSNRGRGNGITPPMPHGNSFMGNNNYNVRGGGRGRGVARSGHFFNTNPIASRDREDRDQNNLEDDYYSDMPAVDRDMASSLGAQGCVVSCYGFPSDLTLQDVMGFFDGYPVDENSIRMRMGEGGVGTGECLLAFEDSESATKAVHYLNGKSLRGHSVKLIIAA